MSRSPLAPPRPRARRRLRGRVRDACCTGRPRPIARSRQRVADDPGRRARARRRGGAGVHRALRRRSQAASVAELELDAGRAAAPRFDGLPAGAARRARGRRRARPQLPRAPARRPAAESWSYRDADGTLLGQKVTPLDRVGIYVPGGKAAYPSSVLMNAMPAKVAGVGEIVMVVPTPGGETQSRWCWPRPHVAGVDRVFTIGGAQAVGALAYGTATVPRGRQDHRPRQRLRGERQAPRVRHGRHRHDRRPERDPGAGRRQRRRPTGWRWTCSARPSTTSWRRASCCAPTPAYIDARAARRSSGCCRRCRARDDHPRLARRPRRADPHAHRWKRPARSATASRPSTWRSARASRSAGSRCCATPARSSSAPSPARAWATTAPGPNHVLPTSGTARFSSPLGVYDFQKRSSLIEVSEAGAAALGPIAAELALRRGPAGPCARGRAAASKRVKIDRMPTLAASTAERIAARASARTCSRCTPTRSSRAPGWSSSTRWRTRSACREALQRELGERLGRGGDQPLSRSSASATCVAALARHVAAAGRLRADARQRLGRADLAAGDGLRRARRDDPGAGARLRDVRDVGAAAGPALRRRAADAPTSSSTRRRCWRRSSAHRPALTYIAYPNNPTANLLDDARDRAHRRRGRRAGRPGGDRRGLPAVLVAQLDDRVGAPRARAGDAHAEQVRPGRRAPRLPDAARRR